MTHSAQRSAGMHEMRLRILLPTKVFLDRPIVKLVAEAENGAFGVLPRHIDFVAMLKPGILSITAPGGRESFVGHDEGVFVKKGQEARVSVRNAMLSQDLAGLRELVEREFVRLDQYERTARTALARLEAGVIRHFIELEEKT